MHDLRRYTTLAHTTVSRDEIESYRHSSIDESLKHFRTVSRRLVEFSRPFSNELQFLERIYYKGKNQHRSSLFWRKVLEIRRLGARIHEMDIPDLVEGMHYSFYEKENRSNPKILRSSWKQCPDATTCISFLRRLRSACLLVDQARSRFRLAHDAFTQQLRTATFLPLIISLISITSRLDFLLIDLRDAIVLQCETVTPIMEAVAITNENIPHSVLLPKDPLCFSAMQGGPQTTYFGKSMSVRLRKPGRGVKIFSDYDFSEDLGNKVIRRTEPDFAISHIIRTSTTEQQPESMTPVVVDTSFVPLSSPSQTNIRDVIAISTPVGVNGKTCSSGSKLPNGLALGGYPGGGKKQKVAKVVTKARLRRDEIDDIFESDRILA